MRLSGFASSAIICSASLSSACTDGAQHGPTDVNQPYQYSTWGAAQGNQNSPVNQNGQGNPRFTSSPGQVYQRPSLSPGIANVQTSSVLSQGNPKDSPPPARSATCYTSMVANPALWNTATTTSVSYYPWTSTKTSTITVTVTPTRSTLITTTTVTNTSTAPVMTSTATSTITDTSTTISTETDVTSTTTVSTSVVYGTSTIPAPAGFIPVQSSLPGLSYSGSDGAVPGKRSLLRVARSNPIGYTDARNTTSGISPRLYPAGVQCYQPQPSPKCSSIVVSITTTVTASPLPATTSTATVTASTTTFPGASTTITTTDTATTSVVIETSSTSIATQVVYSTSITTTVYGACITNNVADNYNGNGLGAADDADQVTYHFVNGLTTAYECCVAAFTNYQSAVTWEYNFNSQGVCTIFTLTSAGTCGQTLPANQWTIVDNAGIKQAIGNGPCGAWSKVSSS